jgi:hypothetical protein
VGRHYIGVRMDIYLADIQVPITVTYNKRDSAYWREIAFGVGEGERNKTLASLTGYLLRRYVDANLVYGLVSASH